MGLVEGILVWASACALFSAALGKLLQQADLHEQNRAARMVRDAQNVVAFRTSAQH